ncbi:CHAT domain-containing protein [Bacteroidota bacterium]
MKKLLFLISFSLISSLAGYPALYSDDETQARRYLERAGFLYESSDYDSLPYYYQAAETIFDGLGQYKASAACMLGMVDCHRMLNRQFAALSKLESAEQYILSHIGQDSESWSDALYIRAKLYNSWNRNQEAIDLLNSSLEFQQELDLDPESSARIYSSLGLAYHNLGDLDSAEINYRKALDSYMEMYREPSMEKGMLLFNMGLVYSRKNDQQKWAEYTLQGVENNISLFGSDFPDLAENYNSLSSYFISIGRLDSAIYYLDKAERIMINAYGNEYHNISRIYVNRARIHRYKGNFRAALDYYLQALSILENQEVPDRFILNSALINLGYLYSSIGEYRKAYEYYARLLDFEGMVHPNRMADFYTYLAEILTKLGNYSEAEGYLKEVFDIRQQFHASNQIGLVYDYQVYGVLMDSTGRPERAEYYFNKALEITLQIFGNYHYRTASIYKLLGDHFKRNNAPDFALEHYQKSIHSLVPEYDMSELDTNPDPDEIANLLFYLQVLKQKAEILENMALTTSSSEQLLKYSLAAFSAYNTAIEVVGMLRTSYLNDESKLYLSENERGTYEKSVGTAFDCYELSGDPEYLKMAFITAEKAKYATLQSVLQREEALSLSGIPDSIRELENGMKMQLAVYQELLIERLNDTLPDQVELQQYRSEIFRLKDQIAGLHRSLEADYPEYYELLYSQKVVDPVDVKKMLGGKDKLIEYFITGEEYYIFEISRELFSCKRFAMDELFLQDLDIVKRYIGGNSIRDSIRDDHFAFIESATRLNSVLIPDPDQFQNLIIIPEGLLSYFPFDVLITEPVPEFSGLFNKVPFLIRSHTIRYGYNASLLRNQKNRKPGNLRRFVGFAPGYMTDEDKITQAYGNRELTINRPLLEPLPGSIDEVTEIGKLLGGDVYIENGASEGKFKALAGESHILHLATHAFLDDDDPLQSTLVFSENPMEKEDGFLKVYELYTMSLKARMVVLSACNTGMGELKGGEGIMSLARAFFYAGVPNIVMTLWTVSDRQSYELMLSFYRHLSMGRKAEKALRKAKLEFLEDANPQYQHPRYWAGYILVGNPEHLFLPGYYRQLLAITGIVLILLIGLITGRRYFRSKSEV